MLKLFSAGVTRRKLKAQNISTLNNKVMFLFIGDHKGRKYFTTNKFYTKISNGEYYGTYIKCKNTYEPMKFFTTNGHKSL